MVPPLLVRLRRAWDVTEWWESLIVASAQAFNWGGVDFDIRYQILRSTSRRLSDKAQRLSQFPDARWLLQTMGAHLSECKKDSKYHWCPERVTMINRNVQAHTHTDGHNVCAHHPTRAEQPINDRRQDGDSPWSLWTVSRAPIANIHKTWSYPSYGELLWFSAFWPSVSALPPESARWCNTWYGGGGVKSGKGWIKR